MTKALPAVEQDQRSSSEGISLYPTRARIIDVSGEIWQGLAIATPPESRPYIGEEGWAEMLDPTDPFSVRITLDSGAVLWGWQCWWEALPSDATLAKPN